MVRLRPFKPQDADEVARWIGDDERAFTMFTAGRYKFPLEGKEIVSRHYAFEAENDAFMMSALDESGRVSGHFIFRSIDFDKNCAHMGFIIASPEKRGKGFGKAMIQKALDYAHDILGINKITLGVFENNEAAYNCYLSSGFKVREHIKDCFEFKDEKWGLFEMEYIFENKEEN